MDGMSPMKFNLEVGLTKWNFKEVSQAPREERKKWAKKNYITYT